MDFVKIHSKEAYSIIQLDRPKVNALKATIKTTTPKRSASKKTTTKKKTSTTTRRRRTTTTKKQA